MLQRHCILMFSYTCFYLSFLVGHLGSSSPVGWFTASSLLVILSFFHIMVQSNGPLYSNTVTGTLAVDGWTQGLLHLVEQGGPGWAAAPPSPLLAVPNVTAHPSAASVPTSYYSMWHYNYLCPLKVNAYQIYWINQWDTDKAKNQSQELSTE